MKPAEAASSGREHVDPSRHGRRVLYAVVCAAPPARQVHVLVELARGAGWDVCVVATPRAAQWIDRTALAQQTGYAVRSDYKHPGEPDVLPQPDAIVVAPATFNTINKWAAGICDTLALGLVCEAIGWGVPVVALPYLNAAQAAHPAFAESVQRLRQAGVRILFGVDVLPLHQPRQATGEFPWQLLVDALPDGEP
jgi:hypothetical protein